MSEAARLRSALNTPLGSSERKALEAKWRNHYGWDGTIHANIGLGLGCRFGSKLRDDVCQPATPTDQPEEIRCGGEEGSDG